jgi:hypothetical protein
MWRGGRRAPRAAAAHRRALGRLRRAGGGTRRLLAAPGRAALLFLGRAIPPALLPALILALGAVAALFLAAGRRGDPGAGRRCLLRRRARDGTLVRAIVLADRYGPEHYGAIASTAAMLALVVRKPDHP